MKVVRMLQQVSGTRNGAEWPPIGGTIEVSDDEARTLGLGQTPLAEIVEDDGPAEEHSAPVESPVGMNPPTRQARSSTAKR